MLEAIDLSVFSRDEPHGIGDSLNTQPRATHHWHSTLEVSALDAGQLPQDIKLSSLTGVLRFGPASASQAYGLGTYSALVLHRHAK